MCSRREFLRTALVAGTVPLAFRVQGALPPEPMTSGFRTITYNIQRAQGYSRKPEGQTFVRAAASQLPARLALELALYKPDVVSFQEAPAESIVASIAAQLKMKYTFFKGGWNGALLSRFEIVDAQNCPLLSWTERPQDLFTRHWGRAILRVSGKDISFFSAHLHPSNAAVRAREVSEILKVMAPSLHGGGPVLFQGDLNHAPSEPEHARWGEAGLTDLFLKLKQPGQAELSVDSDAPWERIDYVWASATLASQAKECRILYEGSFRTNPQDPRSFAISDHVPVTATFGT